MSEITSTALLWGYDALELRSVGGPEDRIPHVSERLIRMSCLEADLQVAAVDPEFFAGSAAERATWMNELATLPEVIRLANRIGCPGLIVGSLADDATADGGHQGREEGDASAASREALERILAETGRLAGRAGLAVHVRAGSTDRLPFIASVIRSVGVDSVRPLPELVVDPARAPSSIPAEAAQAGYVRLLYHGPREISLEHTDRLRDVFNAHLRGLADAGFDGDVCLEFEHRPEPATGLRVSTAFVSALSIV